MSMESAKEFFAKLGQDQQLAQGIAQATDDVARMEIAQGQGFSFTLEELEAARDELDDTALDAVAGGLMEQCGNDGSLHSPGDGILESPGDGREVRNSWGAGNSWGMPGDPGNCGSDGGPV